MIPPKDPSPDDPAQRGNGFPRYSNDAEAIRARMRELRGELSSEVQIAKAKASQAVDWRHIVGKHPVAALGAAAVVGYLLVPNKRYVYQYSDEQVERLAERGKLKVTPAKNVASKSAISSALATVAAIAGRAALSQITQKLSASDFASKLKTSSQPPQPPPTRPGFQSS